MTKVVEYAEAYSTKDGKLFNSMADADSEQLKLSYGLDTELFDSYVFRMPMMNVQSSMYAVIKPKEGNEDAVKTQIDEFLAKYEQQWSMYLPEQTELVQNALIKEDNGYFIVIVSYDNDGALKEIQKAAE